MENGLFFAATSAHLRHADGGRARHRARRAGRHADPRRVHVPDPRAVRQPRHPPPREAEGKTDVGDALSPRPRHRRWSAASSLALRRASRDSPATSTSGVQPGTFVAAMRADRRASIADGPAARAATSEFFIDPLNVFLVALTAFVGLTTAIFSRPYMRVEQDHGKMTPARLRLYHSMYQLFSFTMLLALTTNNVGHPVGGDGGGDADDGAAGQRLPHRRPASRRRGSTSSSAAWASRRRCSARCCSTWRPRRSSAPAGGALLWTQPRHGARPGSTRTSSPLAFAFLFIGYGTKVGLVPLHNWLPDAHAGRSDAGVGGAVRACCSTSRCTPLLRCKVLTDGALHNALAGQPADGLRPGLGRRRGVLPVSAEGRQAHVRVLVDRAHGPDHVRLRPRRPDRQLRRAAAHDRALARPSRRSSSPSATRRRRPARRSWTTSAASIKVSPTVGWGLMLGSLAILGMPPFGVFASEFLILTTAMREQPWATPILLAVARRRLRRRCSAGSSRWCSARPRSGRWRIRRR